MARPQIAMLAALGALLAGCAPLEAAGQVDAGLGLVGLLTGHRCDPGVDTVPNDPNPPPAGECGTPRPAPKANPKP